MSSGSMGFFMGAGDRQVDQGYPQLVETTVIVEQRAHSALWQVAVCEAFPYW